MLLMMRTYDADSATETLSRGGSVMVGRHETWTAGICEDAPLSRYMDGSWSPWDSEGFLMGLYVAAHRRGATVEEAKASARAVVSSP